LPDPAGRTLPSPVFLPKFSAALLSHSNLSCQSARVLLGHGLIPIAADSLNVLGIPTRTKIEILKDEGKQKARAEREATQAKIEVLIKTLRKKYRF